MARIDTKQAAGFLLAGAMVGAAIALLYAPQSGERTKRDIREHVSDWVDDMTDVVKGGVDRGKKLSADGYERVLRGFDDARQCVEDGKARLEQLIKNA